MSEITPTTLAIFDLCDTLVAENTTLGFLKSIGREHPRIARDVKQWTSKAHPKFYFGAFAHRFGHDIARARMIHQLCGFDSETLTDAANIYAEDALVRRGNGFVINRLVELRDDGARVVVVSTSLDIVVDSFARALGVEGRGSRLEWVDGRCTGRIIDDLTGGKQHVVRQLAPAGWECLIAYSDNKLDLPLLRLADQGTFVVPSGRTTPQQPSGVDDVLFL